MHFCILCLKEGKDIEAEAQSVFIRDAVTGQYSNEFLCSSCKLEFSTEIKEVVNLTKKITVTADLPRDTKSENYENIMITFRVKKRKDSGDPIKTKAGNPVLSGAFDLTRLRALIKKYPNIVRKDKYDHDIVWLTGFEKEGDNVIVI